MEHSPSPTPSRAIYGFVLYLFSWIGLVTYLIWAFTPGSWLHAVGITYYPHKYWSIAIPVSGCVLFCMTLLLYAVNNIRITKPFNSLNTISDSHSKHLDFNTVEMKSKSILPVSDLQISHINQVLYD